MHHFITDLPTYLHTAGKRREEAEPRCDAGMRAAGRPKNGDLFFFRRSRFAK